MGKTLWLIPARGGSKGIPDKNLRPFHGKSLTARSILQAKELAGDEDVVYVSTDSEAIRKEAERHGADTPFMRPPELATDTASTYSVITDTLSRFSELGLEFEKVVLLQPTSPFRTVGNIRKAVELWRPDIDMVVSVNLASSNPYYNLFEQNSEGYLQISKGNGGYTRRQDAPEVWEYNGAVYVITVGSILAGPMWHFKRILPYEMPKWQSIDLDTPQDWEIAEILFTKK